MTPEWIDQLYSELHNTANEISLLIEDNSKDYPPEVVQKLREAVCMSRRTAAYIKEIGLLVGDNVSPGSFLSNLKARIDALG